MATEQQAEQKPVKKARSPWMRYFVIIPSDKTKIPDLDRGITKKRKMCGNHKDG